MATRAFILIETQVGRTRQVTEALRSVPGIKSADAITGPYDVIALIEVSEIKDMADLVTTKIQAIRGVERTITCVSAG